ncbi:MAG TPA: FAD-dependent monooxygenase [Saprospiraceae bacterium]|nr:FAD-dependent monooxygenase [Saprospiraceae bacterium]
MKKKVAIVGAGLCGSLLALRLAQLGYQIDVIEKRPDLRKVTLDAGRSINLALSDRGLKGLRLVGLEDAAKAISIPMHGRMIHPKGAETYFMKYSGRETDYINSISRPGLNAMLLDEAEKTGNIKLHFNQSCKNVLFEDHKIQLQDVNGNISYYDYDLVFGTDGAGSAVRTSMSKRSSSLRFNFSQQYLDTGYKELEIPAGENGSFRIEKNALHIWPRDGFMMIALPNLNGSFTVTLFFPFTGSNSFEYLGQDDEKIVQFFNTHFPSAVPHMPDLVEDYHQNPSSSLGTIKCFPWSVDRRSLIMGDAAHAVVPFYGQGMNASFEDVTVLDELMAKHGEDWDSIITEYDDKRKPDADAIGDLAVDNFYEMRDATKDPVFGKKRAIELQLENLYPDYYAKYSLVTFNEDISYHEAMTQGRFQDEVLMNFARGIDDVSKVDISKVKAMMDEKLKEFKAQKS